MKESQHAKSLFVHINCKLLLLNYPRNNANKRHIQITIQIASNCLLLQHKMNSHLLRSKKVNPLPKTNACKRDYAKDQYAEAHPNQLSEEDDDLHEDTMARPLTVQKIKISFDQEETKKIGWEKGFSTLAKPEIKSTQPNVNQAHKATCMESEKPTIQIPYNKKVEEIMNKRPLRERLSGLLPSEMQLPISFDHQQILKRMELVDRTIQFLETHRNMKVFFFETIKKSIYENSSVVIELSLIQQLLFLDHTCYEVEWRLNERNKKYDIKIALPRFDSMDLRKLEMRKKIVKFLIFKQAEFLAAKKLTKVDLHKWHDLFDYKKISIPQKSLPVHPHHSTSDLRAFPDEEMDKISNPALKMLLKKKKEVSQVKSLSSASVVDMIFSKVPASQISNQILGMVKEKEKISNELKQRQKTENERVDKQALLRIYDEILLIFMSKNVGNIFKVTLVQLLQQRLQLNNELICTYVEELLKMEGMEFLKVIQSSRKIEVVQINKQKYKEVRDLVSTKF